MRLLVMFFLISGVVLAQDGWETDYEKSAFKSTPRYEATVEYCRRMADASPFIEYQSFGTSPQGRELPLLIVNMEKRFTPEAVRAAGQPVVYIQAGIHSGEIDGKDAGLMLIRDLVMRREQMGEWENVVILFNPIFNVDGHERFGPFNRANQNGPDEMGWRTTAQNYNLNRDYLKADAPEMQHFLKLYSAWEPDFFIDCHVTDGADYQYTVTYKIDLHGVADPRIVEWSRDVYLPSLQKKMHSAGFPVIEYVSFRRDHDLFSGMASWATPPRLSDGYVALRNRPGLLIETHMFKDYKTRVEGTYQMLWQTIKILQVSGADLLRRLKLSDEFTASVDFRSRPVALTFRYQRDSTMIDFLGYEQDVVKSDLTGGDWYRFFQDRPKTYRIPFFNRMEPEITVQPPLAYILPPEWTTIIDRLGLHGVQMHRLSEETPVKVSTWQFSHPLWRKTPYENHHTLEATDKESVERVRTYPKGSLVLPLNQRTAKVIIHALEPDGPDSFLFWGFFDAIFEQKEYIESYVLEVQARQMLINSPQLKEEFQTRVAADSVFSSSPQAIRDWFYHKSPYWDQNLNQYPVGRIEDEAILRSLPLEALKSAH